MLVEILVLRQEYFFGRLRTVDNQTYLLLESHPHHVRYYLHIFEEGILAEIYYRVVLGGHSILA